MSRILTYLSYVSTFPAALTFVFLLNSQWRVGTGGKALLLIWSAAASVPLPALLLGRPQLYVLFLLLPLLVSLPPLWWASRVRDARFLFTVLSGVLFACLINSLADKLVFPHYALSLIVRLLLHAGLFFLCWRYYRPALPDVFHIARRGRVLLCALPLVLLGAYLVQLLSPGYLLDRYLPQVRLFTFSLLLITVFLYAVILSFFKRLRLRHENAVVGALLDAQLGSLSGELERQKEAAGRARILRHDLRHYLPILSQRLREGDGAGAQNILDSMRALLSGQGGGGRREV